MNYLNVLILILGSVITETKILNKRQADNGACDSVVECFDKVESVELACDDLEYEAQLEKIDRSEENEFENLMEEWEACYTSNDVQYQQMRPSGNGNSRFINNVRKRSIKARLQGSRKKRQVEESESLWEDLMDTIDDAYKICDRMERSTGCVSTLQIERQTECEKRMEMKEISIYQKWVQIRKQKFADWKDCINKGMQSSQAAINNIIYP